MEKEQLKEILDDISLDTERIESLNDIIREIGDEYAHKDVHLSNKIYTLTYCINEIVQATNKKIESIYTNVSDEEKDQ